MKKVKIFFITEVIVNAQGQNERKLSERTEKKTTLHCKERHKYRQTDGNLLALLYS